jgi:hypothetical protein
MSPFMETIRPDLPFPALSGRRANRQIDLPVLNHDHLLGLQRYFFSCEIRLQ